MSSNALLEAFGVWDRRYLARRRTNPVVGFLWEIMHLRSPLPSDAARSNRDPLVLIALGIEEEINGNLEAATARYARLLRSQDSLTRLLGAELIAWTPSADARQVRLAVNRVERHYEAGLIRCLHYCKLLSISLDKGQMDLAEQCWARARADSEPKSGLRQQLDSIGFNLFGQPLILDGIRRHGSYLVDAHWVNDALAAASERQVAAGVQDWARTGMSYSVQIGGGGPGHEFSGIDFQATWAGLVWRLPQIRLALSSALLLRDARTPQQYELGLATWVLGSGGETAKVAAAVAPHLGPGGADRIIANELAYGHRFARYSGVVEIASTLWDELSEATAIGLLENLTAGFYRRSREAALMCARLMVIAPPMWSHTLSQLGPVDRVEIVSRLPIGLHEHVPASVLPMVANSIFDAIKQGKHREDSDVLVLADEYREWTGRDSELDDAVTTLSASDIVLLKREGFERVKFVDLSASISTLREQCESALVSAQSGTIHGYSISPFRSLGIALGMSLDGHTDDAHYLVQCAASEAPIPGSYLVDVLEGISEFSEWTELAQFAEAIARSRRKVVPDYFSGVSVDLISIERLNAIAPWSYLVKGFVPEVATAVRHSEARVRLRAVSATIKALLHAPVGYSGYEVLRSSLIAALWDPDATIVRQALWGVSQVPLEDDVTESVAYRVVELFNSGRRDIRETVLKLSVGSEMSGIRALAPTLLARGHTDRSWIVRRTARILEEL